MPQIGLYCSDVSGAFDRVESGKLLAKLARYGVHPKLLCLVGSWLAFRTAVVVVNGVSAQPRNLSIMVFQGAVFVPCLWNAFCADECLARLTGSQLDTIFVATTSTAANCLTGEFLAKTSSLT